MGDQGERMHSPRFSTCDSNSVIETPKERVPSSGSWPSETSNVGQSNVEKGRDPRLSLDDRAMRIQLAYQDAARKMQQKGKLARFTEGLNRASEHDSVLKRRMFGERWRQVVDMVEGNRFQGAVASLIILNAIFIGVTSDMSMQRSIESYDQQAHGVYADIPMPEWALVMDVLFNVTFMIELAFRLVVLETRFFIGPDWRWNIFDSFLVLLSVLEVSLAGVGFNPSFMRVLRVTRVTRS